MMVEMVAMVGVQEDNNIVLQADLVVGAMEHLAEMVVMEVVLVLVDLYRCNTDSLITVVI